MNWLDEHDHIEQAAVYARTYAGVPAADGPGPIPNMHTLSLIYIQTYVNEQRHRLETAAVSAGAWPAVPDGPCVCGGVSDRVVGPEAAKQIDPRGPPKRCGLRTNHLQSIYLRPSLGSHTTTGCALLLEGACYFCLLAAWSRSGEKRSNRVRACAASWLSPGPTNHRIATKEPGLGIAMPEGFSIPSTRGCREFDRSIIDTALARDAP